MRRIIVSMNITLDGFIAGPDGALDWQFNNWTNDMARMLGVQLAMADTILLGRNTYDAMAAYWPGVACGSMGLSRDDIAYATLMNDYPKIVCSNTLKKAHWRNSHIISNGIGAKIKKIKLRAGKDIVVYGSGKLVQYLAKKQLIDEYQLWVYPVTLGKGNPLFINRQSLRLLNSRQFQSGVVLSAYKPANLT